jgi:hypothetical protein
MHRFVVLIISLFAFALTACPPAPPTPPAEVTASSTAASTSGAGGADAGVDPGDAATSDASTSAEASTSAATGAPTDGCVGPSPKHKTCDNPGDCYDSSACTEDICDLGTPPNPPDAFGRKGTCIWRLLPDGAPCDVSDGHDTCRAGACCPGTDGDAGATTALPVPASGVK